MLIGHAQAETTLIFGLIILVIIIFMSSKQRDKLYDKIKAYQEQLRYYEKTIKILTQQRDKNLERRVLKTKIHKTNSGNYFCWVNEYGGYYAYCHSDGRLKTRSGYGHKFTPTRTWSSVGEEVLRKNLKDEV